MSKQQSFRLVQIEYICKQPKKSIQKFYFVSGMEENFVGKGENAGNQHFLLCPPCFQKARYSVLLSCIYVVKSLSAE